MDRKFGLLITGAGLLAGAVHQLEDNAVESLRHEVVLGVRQHGFHGRQLTRNVGAFLGLVIAIVLLWQGLRTASSEVGGGVGADPVEPDGEPRRSRTVD